MANFDFSGIGVKAKTSADYGFLVDKLDIKRNQLESDGKLSPGDYDLLKKEAQSIYAHPGLSEAQRSNVLVKISQYDQEKKVNSQKDLNDIKRLTNETNDDFYKNSMLFGNDPELFLQSNSDALRLKMERLSESIDQLTFAGDDATNHIVEYQDALSEYQDMSQAFDDVKNHVAGQSPTSNYVAFVTTNSSGEISNVKIGRTGSNSGYVETNGLYGGLQIYGKVNRKENGKNVFQLGNETFSGSDLTIQDPSVPGAFRSAPLLSSDTKAGKNYGVIVESYKDMDPTQMKSQSAIRSGGWAEGSNGFLYERLDDGSYKKYVNTTKDKLGIKDSDIIKIPSNMEQGILGSIKETVDGSVSNYAPVPLNSASAGQMSIAPKESQVPVEQQTQSMGTSRTPSPTVRAPSQSSGMASDLIKKAGGVLKYIFSKE